MVAHAVLDAEQRSVVFAVNAVDVLGVEPLIAQVQIDRPMRAAIQIRDQAGARVTKHEARYLLACLLQLEGSRLSGRELRCSHDAQPRPAHASAARDGPPDVCGLSGSPAVSSFISSRHSGLPLRWVISTPEASKKLFSNFSPSRARAATFSRPVAKSSSKASA